MSRIAIVKADKARAVEDLLIRMAQGGQVRSKITEKQLIELLEQVNQQTKSETKIVVSFLCIAAQAKEGTREKNQIADHLIFSSSALTILQCIFSLVQPSSIR